jgi:hypothetical protein
MYGFFFIKMAIMDGRNGERFARYHCVTTAFM